MMRFVKVPNFVLMKVGKTANDFEITKDMINDTLSKYGFDCAPIVQGELEKIKGVDANMIHFVIRYLNIQEITEDDLVFVHDGRLAKWVDIPKIEV